MGGEGRAPGVGSVLTAGLENGQWGNLIYVDEAVKEWLSGSLIL